MFDPFPPFCRGKGQVRHCDRPLIGQTRFIWISRLLIATLMQKTILWTQVGTSAPNHRLPSQPLLDFVREKYQALSIYGEETDRLMGCKLLF